ncbi:peptidoglycan editing factor PgeF [Colwelliaceae bacterium MEBiC 14330]
MSTNISDKSLVKNSVAFTDSAIELVNWATDKTEPEPMSEKVFACQTTNAFARSNQVTKSDKRLSTAYDNLLNKENKPFGYFNLGLHVGDNAQRVIANRSSLTQYIKQTVAKDNDASQLDIQWLEQVHGNEVVVVSTVNQQAIIADASITRQKNIALAVMTADCLPILLSAADGKEVAAIHGGWRSLSANIIEKTLEKMQTEPQDIKAWLGPCIGPNSFEVGSEVKDCFIEQSHKFAQAFIDKANGKSLCNLHRIAKLKLTALGIEAIASLPECTYENSTKYYSYRKSQTTGRMATIICRR